MARRKEKLDPHLLALEKCNLITDASAVPRSYEDGVVDLVEKMQIAIASRSTSEDFTFKLENFEFGGKLGKGRFGTVFLVREKFTEFILALKSVEKELLVKANNETDFEREIRVHSKLSHPHIVKFYSMIDDSVNWYILMEYVPGGNLARFHHNQKDYRTKPSIVMKYSCQLADALSYIHSLKIVHRAVKPENILLDVFGNVKLTDFGWSACCTCALSRQCGTSHYIAPEILENKLYDYKVDVWSLGIVIYELLCGEIPYMSKDVKFMLKKISKGNLTFPDDVDKLAVDLIMKMLKYEPEQRLSASEIMNHPWLHSYALQ